MEASERQRHPRRLLRYALFQVPEAVIVAVLLTAAVQWWDWSIRLALLLFAAWVLKDAVMYRFVAIAYEPDSEILRDPLIGALGVATQTLDPSGYVRVGAELWRAVAQDGRAPIRMGASVRVRERRDLTLVVEPASPAGGVKRSA